METILTNVGNVIVELLNNPVVQGSIVTMLVGLLGRATLERVPVFGAILRIINRTIDTYLAQREAAQIEAGANAALILVEGQEQLRKIGKVDAATAAATVTAEVARIAKVNTDVARQITEAAVRQLPETKLSR